MSQSLQCWFRSVEECKNHRRKKIQTNPRYSSFCQTHFTVGDTEQFETHRNHSHLSFNLLKVPKSNIFSQFGVNLDCEKYKNIDAISVYNTFSYIFHKFKKGIFIRIQNNKLKTFLPFSKFNFINEWANRISYSKKYKNPDDFFGTISELNGYNYNPRYTNKFKEKWYANNSLIRYEFPISEGDSGACQMYHMLETLCSERKLPDMEFFINRRDFPLLRKNGTEPYTKIFGNNHELVSHKYEKYCPILSMVENTNYDDISIPTWEDWSRVCNQEDGIYFPKTERNFSYDFSSIKWEDKKPIAIFRGGCTGEGTTINNNIRLKASFLSWYHRNDEEILLDAGITKWNIRPKIGKNGILEIIDYRDLQFSLKNEISPLEQSKHKYILHLSGHVEAFRLSLELQMGSVILLPNCNINYGFKNFSARTNITFHLMKI